MGGQCTQYIVDDEDSQQQHPLSRSTGNLCKCESVLLLCVCRRRDERGAAEADRIFLLIENYSYLHR